MPESAVSALGAFASGARSALERVRADGCGDIASIRALQTQLETEWETIAAAAAALDGEGSLGVDEANALRLEQEGLRVGIKAQRETLKQQMHMLNQAISEMDTMAASAMPKR